MKRKNAALLVSVLLCGISSTQSMAEAAEIEHRARATRRRRRAVYAAAVAGLMHGHYAEEADVRALCPPIRSECVPSRWASIS